MEADSGFDIPSLIPTCNDLEGALDDVLRPLKAAAGVFWAFDRKPETEEQQTIIDLCLMIEDVACQIRYLIEHAKIEGKPVAFAMVEHPCTKAILRKEGPMTTPSECKRERRLL